MGRAAIAVARRAELLGDIGPRAMISINRAVKAIAKEEAARAGSPLVGKKKRGIRLGAYDSIDEGAVVTFGQIKGRPAGPWVWVTSGTKPHSIRRRKRGPLKKMTVHHPGTAGRGAWDNVRRRAAKIVPDIVRDELDEVTR